MILHINPFLYDGLAIALIQPGPTIYRPMRPINCLTLQSLRQKVEMDVPARKTFAQAGVGSRKYIAEGENATVGSLFEFEAEHSVNIACILQQARWVELRNRRVHNDI